MSIGRQIRNALRCALYENRYAPKGQPHSDTYIRKLKLLLIDCAG